MATTPLAEFSAVVKKYPLSALWTNSHLLAVDHVSFRIEPGEVFGLVGPNRAGKTTLVKLLLSLTQPSAGSITRLGQPVCNTNTLARVGYVHEHQAFPRYLTAETLLHYYGSLSLVPPDALEVRVPRLLEKVGLADRSREPIHRFSKGMIQRLGLAQALLNDPVLLVLDEPSEGLDLLGRDLVREIIRERTDAGNSVLFVSHLVGEVEKLCDRIGVLVRGQLAFLGTPAELAAGGSLETKLHSLYRELPKAG